MQVVLVMFRSDGERRSFSVVRNMTIIGRREDCDLRIPVGEVSRKHCRLVMTDDGIRIEDLGSSNGTWVNGQRVQESDLSPGDTVTVGPVQFIVQINGVPADDELTAPAPLAQPSLDDDDSMMGYTAPTPPSPAAGVADSGEFTIDQEVPALAPAETEEDEFQIEEELAAAPQPVASDEFALEEEPAPAEPVASEEFALEEEPLAEVEPDSEIEPLGEAEIVADPEDDLELPEFPAAAVAGEEEFEMPDLEAAPATPEATTTPAAGNSSDSEWDFVVEENDAEEASTDFKIDLDSPHQQPHK